MCVTCGGRCLGTLLVHLDECLVHHIGNLQRLLLLQQLIEGGLIVEHVCHAHLVEFSARASVFAYPRKR